MQFQYYVLIALLLSRHNGLCEEEEESSTTRKYRITDTVSTCSDRLSKFIAALCGKVIKIVKRDATSLMIDKLAPKDLHINGEPQKWGSKRLVRMRRQVASECCNQACTVGNLIMYCSDEAKLVQEDPDIFT
ncbi:uncharacterized protein LOC126369837 [Pectinophora gossypiella]|uniref:uncharacterized protein LOC126369837 n=1 Tax=Pectinophora gossypiella TaxID=13191 RepID=UPI00214E8B79|nr:uncharacterized protein LOC126369837 [Pectinophora gossypiella]